MTLKHFGTLFLYLSTKQNKFGCSVGCGYPVRKDDVITSMSSKKLLAFLALLQFSEPRSSRNRFVFLY
jgi:hypothetical protein